MRSDPIFRLSACQPRPGFGSGPARVWAFRHQSCARTRLPLPSLGEGSTGPLPVPRLIFRASSKAASASAVRGVVCS